MVRAITTIVCSLLLLLSFSCSREDTGPQETIPGSGIKSVRVLLPVDDKADRSRLFFIRGSWYHDGIDNDGTFVIEHIVPPDFYRTPAVIIIFCNRSGQGVDCS